MVTAKGYVMLSKTWIFVAFVVLCVLIPVAASGHGFANYIHGAKSAGMAGAFTALADDPTAIFHNPAGILQLEGSHFTVGFTTFLPGSTFKSNGTSGMTGTYAGQNTDMKDKTWIAPNIFLTHKINDRVAVGIGEFSSFGMGTEWPDNWEGRFAVGSTKSLLKTYSINPVIALKPTKRLAVAFGVVAQRLSFELKGRKWIDLRPLGIPMSPVEINSKLEGDDWDWGWNASFLFSITKGFKVGASYRSEVSHTIKNIDVTFEPEIRTLGLHDTGAVSRFKTPAMLFMGMAWTTGSWTVTFDADWTQWSTYDNLSLRFDSPVGGVPGMEVEKNWHDSWTLGWGIQYMVNRYLDLRAGFVYDESPIPHDTLDPSIIHGDSRVYCLGFGTHYGNVTVDFAYNYIDSQSQTYNNLTGDEPNPGGGRVTGTFRDNNCHILILQFDYHF